MRHIIIDGEKYLAKKIIKEKSNIRLINVMSESGEDWGNLLFPNLLNKTDRFTIIGDGRFDLSEEDERVLYDVDIDFRLSIIEMGVNINDL